MATTPAASKMGWTVSILVGLVLIASASAKLIGGAAFEEGFKQMGFPASIRIPLGLLEIIVAVVYLIPMTSVLGAVLVAGYLGGAIVTHWRVGDMVVIPAVLGVLAWLGIWLREPRLKELLPLRRASSARA